MCLLLVWPDGADDVSVGYFLAGGYLCFVDKEDGVGAIRDAGPSLLTKYFDQNLLCVL
jgi:hypothetical protein